MTTPLKLLRSRLQNGRRRIRRFPAKALGMVVILIIGFLVFLVALSAGLALILSLGA